MPTKKLRLPISELVELVNRRVEAGLDYFAIAKELGISYGLLYVNLRKAGYVPDKRFIRRKEVRDD